MSGSVILSRRCATLGLEIIKHCSKHRGIHTSVVKRTLNNRNVGLVGLPFHHGQSRAGVAFAPEQLRSHGLVESLQDLDCQVHDYGDLEFEILNDASDPPQFHIKHPRTNGLMARQISDKVQQIVSNGEIALNIGGDHSIGIGTVHGHLQAHPDGIVVWVDAQPDLNPPLASPSGNIHGMALTFLSYELQKYMFRVKGFEWCKPCLSVDDLIYIGLRDIDPAEKYLLDLLEVKCYTPDDIDKHGLDYIMEHAMDLVNPGLKRPIHLSYDVDGMDPKVIPATGTPVSGGLTMDEGLYICEELALTGKLTCIDMVEINTDLAKDEKSREMTIANATNILKACFTRERRPDENIPRKRISKYNN